MTELSDVQQVTNEYATDLLNKENVIGVGTGIKQANGVDGRELSIVTLVTEKKPMSELSAADLVPREIHGIPTDVFEVGVLRAQQRDGRYRPAPGGVSIGHFNATYGTLGVIVTDPKDGKKYILSNNHVLAHNNRGRIGDRILQPGPANGGRHKVDTIATLARYLPIQFVNEPRASIPLNLWSRVQLSLARLLKIRAWLARLEPDETSPNLIDAALAKPLNESDILSEVLEIGPVSGVLVPVLGMEVRKSGSSTGLNQGMITVVDTTVDVIYEENRTARFEHQFLTTPMSKHGDSGALLVACDSLQAVGLLFAGSEKASIYNPIQTVLTLLEVTL